MGGFFRGRLWLALDSEAIGVRRTAFFADETHDRQGEILPNGVVASCTRMRNRFEKFKVDVLPGLRQKEYA
jgi:hypothetical protein